MVSNDKLFIFNSSMAIDRIDAERFLSKIRKKREAELNQLINHIKYYVNHCHHIVVSLGCDKYRCLLCNKVMDKSCNTSFNIINAENYLPQYNMENEEECNYKYELIRDIAYDLLKRKTDINFKDFILELNCLIEAGVILCDESNSQKLIRKIK